MLGCSKKGTKPKQLLTQVSSYALRSSILSGLQEASQDKTGCLKTAMDATEKQQYQLNCKKHHHYQPDSKIYQKVKETQAAEESLKVPQALQQKWVGNKDVGCLGKVRDITMELEKLPANLSGDGKSAHAKDMTRLNGIRSKLKIVKNKNKNGRIVIVISKYMENSTQTSKVKKEEDEARELLENQADQALEKNKLSKKHSTENRCREDNTDEARQGTHKRRYSEPNSKRDSEAKRFLSFRSLSEPNAGTNHGQTNGRQISNGHRVGSSDCQDEPMDLSCSRQRKETSSVPDSEANGISEASEKEVEQTEAHMDSEPVSSFTPFLGNIIITDITANCLTVTFKEYVTV
ncbi:E3 SUMO-protein ligase CBX4-like isoform X2 [Hoplias malabaricus]